MSHIEASQSEAAGKPDKLEGVLGYGALVGTGGAVVLPEGLGQKISAGIGGVAFLGFGAKIWYENRVRNQAIQQDAKDVQATPVNQAAQIDNLRSFIQAAAFGNLITLPPPELRGGRTPQGPEPASPPESHE